MADCTARLFVQAGDGSPLIAKSNIGSNPVFRLTGRTSLGRVGMFTPERLISIKKESPTADHI
jgi:hypothetical protein